VGRGDWESQSTAGATRHGVGGAAKGWIPTQLADPGRPLRRARDFGRSRVRLTQTPEPRNCVIGAGADGSRLSRVARDRKPVWRTGRRAAKELAGYRAAGWGAPAAACVGCRPMFVRSIRVRRCAPRSASLYSPRCHILVTRSAELSGNSHSG